jgi:nicotinamidase-related amidase
MANKRINLTNATLLSMEMQRGVVGDLAPNRQITDAVTRLGIVPRLAALMDAARAAGATVVHCNAEYRPDLKGTARNAPLLSVTTKNPGNILAGSAGAATMPALGPKPEDIVFHRFHGMTPFTGTSLDITLRNLGVDTVVACGISLNVGVFGLCVEAVGLGYRVVVARDCVAGFPDEYGEAIIKNSLSMLCSISTAEELTALWREQRPASAAR